MLTNAKDECRLSSTQRKLNTTPLLEISELAELLPQRKKQRHSSKLTKDEIKYQHFVRDLKKDIQIYMKQSLRENRFDTRDNQSSKTDPSIRLLRTAIGSHRTTDTETVITNRQDPMSFLKYNETKRIAADVQIMLTAPTMKTFYTQFIRRLPTQQQQQTPVPLGDSFFNVSEQ